jgi:hypothetical protein
MSASALECLIYFMKTNNVRNITISERIYCCLNYHTYDAVAIVVEERARVSKRVACKKHYIYHDICMFCMIARAQMAVQ